jgi:hypothetical protein
VEEIMGAIYANYVETYDDVLSVNVTDSYFTPDFVDPSGGTTNYAFVFTSLTGGAQAAADGTTSKIELFYDNDGTGDDLILIDAIFTVGETYQHILSPTEFEPFIPGTSRILVRRTVYSPDGVTYAAREIYGQWQGQIT